MKKILFIVGSLRKGSFNRQLMEIIRTRLEGRAETEVLDYTAVPFMNQDIEYPAPEAVKAVREKVLAADGIWIVTPEYNFSYPGVLKNVLDWLSRPLIQNDYETGSALKGKKTTFSGCAGKSGAAGSMGKLSDLLMMMRTSPMKEPVTGVSLTPDAFGSGILSLSDEKSAALDKQIDAFLEFLA